MDFSQITELRCSCNFFNEIINRLTMFLKINNTIYTLTDKLTRCFVNHRKPIKFTEHLCSPLVSSSIALLPTRSLSQSLHFSTIVVRHLWGVFKTCVTGQSVTFSLSFGQQASEVPRGKYLIWPSKKKPINLHSEWYMAQFIACKKGQTSDWLFIYRFTGD